MLHPSTKKLIDRLAAMTAQKKIDWIEKDNGDVLYATEGYVVRLTPEPPRVLLATESGKSLEDATTTVLNATPHDDGGTYGEFVALLARDACRDARGTEHAISTLLAGLEESAPLTGDAASESEEAAETAEPTGESELAGVPIGPDAVEDPVDDTTALETQDDADAADLSDTEHEIETDEDTLSADTGETVDTNYEEFDTPEAALDESLPETALAESLEAELEAANEAEAEDEDVEFATLDNEQDDSEEFVGGAVARLADEVNSRSSESDEPAAAELDDDGADSEEEHNYDATAPLSPSFAIQPDDGPSFSDEQDEIAPEAAAPVEGDAYEDHLPDTDSLEPAVMAETPATDLTDEAPEPSTAEATESTEHEPAAAPASVWDAAPASEADEREPESSATVSDEAEADPIVNAFSAAEPEQETDTPVAETQELEEATAAPDIKSAASNVHYIPFGAGGIEAAGADASEETADVEADEDETVDSSLATAATTMTFAAPETEDSQSEAAEADESNVETVEFSRPAESESAAEQMDAAEDESTSADQPEQSIETQPETPNASAPFTPAGSFSLSSLGAGIGFGTTSTGFQPSPPKPAGEVQPAEESVSKASVFIDATDDYPGDSSVSDSTGIPDVSDLAAADDYVEASVSNEDLDAVVPPEAPSVSSLQEPDRALSLVDNQNASEQSEEETADETPRPSRPKTRFNPWT